MILLFKAAVVLRDRLDHIGWGEGAGFNQFARIIIARDIMGYIVLLKEKLRLMTGGF